MGTKTIGISTYLTHYFRYKLLLRRARTEKYKGSKELEFKLIRSSTTPFWRKPINFLYGVMGLVKEYYRLIKYGFEKSANEKRSAGKITDNFKKFVGEN